MSNSDAFEHYHVSLYDSEDSYYDEPNRVVGIASKKLGKRILEFRRILKKIQPDLVYSWGSLTFLLAAINSVPKRFVLINGSIRHGIHNRNLHAYYRTALLYLSRYVVANSIAGLRANGIKKGFVLRNGIDPKFDLEARMQSDDAQNKRDSKFVFCSVANLVPIKDYATIFLALHKFLSVTPDFCYYIIGQGPLLEKHKNMVNDLSLSDQVVFLGGIPDPEKYLTMTDVFIHSSKGEGCSNAILEAMYMGLPVVASKTGGTPEIVKENGILFEYGDEHALFNALQQLFRDRVTRLKMGKESYRMVKENFTQDKMIQNYQRIVAAIYAGQLYKIDDLTYVKKAGRS